MWASTSVTGELQVWLNLSPKARSLSWTHETNWTQPTHLPTGAPTMPLHRRIIACLMTCTLIAASAGCTSMKSIRLNSAPTASPFGKVNAGDTVEVETRDGRRERFVVQQIEGDAIISPTGARYTVAGITRLKRRSFSGPKTTLLAGGIFAGVFVVLAAAAAAAVGSLIG